ncbi:hypothetical protein KDK_25250 [Dictyobacter kobayashii]|uniref:HTH luxR-type domain-containing protein n=2 Tax=Dictyobacter kobayashii TaxID=2014872 RepID=A0A402AI40_9CHLR|nr:hypothetical protein KDK_25250 [Dictyobacter kobayashii]
MGTYTVRKEKAGGNQVYWYGYQRVAERLQKKYLAKEHELSLERLEEVALFFHPQTEADTASVVQQANQPAEASVRVGEETQQQTSISLNPILATKLKMPSISSRLVPRPQLYQQLQKVLEVPLTLVAAPAGFGKSTLVSSWLKQSNSATAWVSLEKSDDEPMYFWTYIFTACNMLYSGSAEVALSLLHALPPPKIESILAVLINSLVTLPHEVIIVLDDYHSIENNSIHQGMSFLIDHLPEQVHLLIATRADPMLPIARLRSRGQLIELRAADLRFSTEEIKVFLQQENQLALSPQEISALEERTEGWATGLQLASLSLQGQKDTGHFIQLFTGSHRYIVDYLVQEVLEQLTIAQQQFLLQTALLSRLNSDLCEAVTGQSAGQEMLQWLEQANLFLISLDDERRWYRYHHLFADMLKQRLQQKQPELIPELHRRAWHWFLQQDLFQEAMVHAREMHDLAAIADITERFGLALVNAGETATVVSWCELLPEEQRLGRLRIFLFEVWTLIGSGQFAPMLEKLKAYEHYHHLPSIAEVGTEEMIRVLEEHVNTQCPRDQYDNEHRANLLAEILTLYGTLIIYHLISISPLAPSSSATSLVLIQNAMTHIQKLAHRGRIVQHLGLIYFILGENGKAIEVFEEASLSAMADDSLTWVPAIAFQLTSLLWQVGQLHRAESAHRKILNWASQSEKRLLTLPASYFELGQLYYEWNRLVEAEEYITEGMRICKRLGMNNGSLAGLNTLISIKLARGDEAEAHALFRTYEELIGHEQTNIIYQQQIQATHAYLEYRLGNNGDVRRWLLEGQEEIAAISEHMLAIQERPYTIRAYLLQKSGYLEEAQDLTARLKAVFQQRHWQGRIIHLLILQALQHQMLGDNEQASDKITQALILAEPEGYQRIFLDEGRAMAILLGQLREERRKEAAPDGPSYSLAFLDQLIVALRNQLQRKTDMRPDGTKARQEQELADPLSERELEVLSLISEGRSNREIAEQMIIALSTVKSHINTIYNKIQANNRTQAIARARKLKLLD